MLRTKSDWEKIYQNKTTPWDATVPEPHLVAFVRSGTLQPCTTIDLGCGTGNEALFLAQQGFSVTGIDIAELAIQEAWQRAEKAGATCTFTVGNVLDIPLDTKYDLAIDRGCFHFLDPEEQIRYVQNLHQLLNPGGLVFLVVSSEHDAVKGPHQFSKEDIGRMFGTLFTIMSIALVTLETHETKPTSYVCVLKKK